MLIRWQPHYVMPVSIYPSIGTDNSQRMSSSAPWYLIFLSSRIISSLCSIPVIVLWPSDRWQQWVCHLHNAFIVILCNNLITAKEINKTEQWGCKDCVAWQFTAFWWEHSWLWCYFQVVVSTVKVLYLHHPSNEKEVRTDKTHGPCNVGLRTNLLGDWIGSSDRWKFNSTSKHLNVWTRCTPY